MKWGPLLSFAFRRGSEIEALIDQEGSGDHATLILDVLEANSKVVKKYRPDLGPLLDDFIATLREVTSG